MAERIPEALTDAHVLGSFRSGQPILDAWLSNDARRADAQGICRVFVWPGDPSIEAFFSIAPTEVHREHLPNSASGGHSRIPSYLIGRLALDEGLQGQGLGSELLIDALAACVRAARTGGGRLILVDPIDEGARGFYLAHDFRETSTSERLWMKVATAAQALGL